MTTTRDIIDTAIADWRGPDWETVSVAERVRRYEAQQVKLLAALGASDGASAEDGADPTEVFRFRETHGGRAPGEARGSDATDVAGADELSPEDIFRFRETHGGKAPWEVRR